MSLASLRDTYFGAGAGAALAAIASRNKEESSVSTIKKGAFWGAATPSIIALVHNLAGKALNFLSENVRYLKDSATELAKRGFSYAEANPAIASASAVGLAALLLFYYNRKAD